jgi:2-haloacid dehalogenase
MPNLLGPANPQLLVKPPIEAVVFDLGGVLIDWNPRHLYRKLFHGDEDRMEMFLAEVCTQDWNEQQDAGRSWMDAIDILAREHPDQRGLIEAYYLRWEEMLGSPIQETVDVLGELRGTGVHLYGLSNWSAETFPIARRRYPFLGWFDAMTISGEIGIRKPDARAFQHLLTLHTLEPTSTVFVDDSEANVAAAHELGMIAIPFTSGKRLRDELRSLGLLPAPLSAGQTREST